MRNICITVLVVLIISCSKNKLPADVIEPSKMEVVLWDIIKADLLTLDNSLKDSAYKSIQENIKLQKKIFLAHSVTKEQFNKSFNYYAENPGLMTALLDSMIINDKRKYKSPVKINQQQ
ncbi:MAG: DUF4296 domain-containing protein [Ferruginibacter sp.]